MSEFLLAISIGPVQGMISAARRTRDLWMGSIILSEVAKAVSLNLLRKYLHDDLERLIFPAPQSRGNLEPIDPWVSGNQKRVPAEDFSASNVILCRVEAADEETMFGIAADAKRQSAARWLEFAVQAGNRARDAGILHAERWEQQLEAIKNGDAVEFFASWTRLEQDYPTARRRVVRLLNGRKALRDFQAWKGWRGCPKSSLDGARESVLIQKRELRRDSLPTVWDQQLQGRSDLRIRKAEELDIIGLTKRVEYGENEVRFPSLSRFAADPWIRGIKCLAGTDSELRTVFEKTLSVCRELCKNKTLIERKGHDLELFPWVRDFPFEGSILYVDRHRELRDDTPLRHRDDATNLLAEASRLISNIRKRTAVAAPEPYLAILKADGDRMGRALSCIKNEEAHRRISQIQSEFSKFARDFVRGLECRGACAYAGADDILAFLPVDRCLACAKGLSEAFTRIVGKRVWNQVDDDAKASLATPPTLSVGIAVGHFMEPMEDLLHYATRAERWAKSPTPSELDRGQSERNGLAISIHARGGAPFTVRDNWDQATAGVGPIADRIEMWASLALEADLPAKVAYELRELSRSYGHWNDSEAKGRAIRLHASSVIGRKQTDAPTKAFMREVLAGVRDEYHVRAIAEEMLVGQWIAKSQRQACGPGGARMELASAAT